MALNEHLSAAGRAALAKVIEYGGGTPGHVLERAVVALRESVVCTTPYVSVDVGLSAELQVFVAHAGRQPRLMIAGHGVEVDFAPANDIPTAAEVDAIERIYDAVAEARDAFRTAYATCTTTDREEGPTNANSC